MFELTQDNIITLISFTGLIILLYTILFAARFLYLTVNEDPRKPWEILTYAVILMFIIRIILFFKINIPQTYMTIIDFALITTLLFVFLSQSFYMNKSNYQTIRRKQFVPIKTKEDKTEAK